MIEDRRDRSDASPGLFSTLFGRVLRRKNARDRPGAEAIAAADRSLPAQGCAAEPEESVEDALLGAILALAPCRPAHDCEDAVDFISWGVGGAPLGLIDLDIAQAWVDRAIADGAVEDLPPGARAQVLHASARLLPPDAAERRRRLARIVEDADRAADERTPARPLTHSAPQDIAL